MITQQTSAKRSNNDAPPRSDVSGGGHIQDDNRPQQTSAKRSSNDAPPRSDVSGGGAALLLGDVGHHGLGVLASTTPELGDTGGALLVQPAVQARHGGHGCHAAAQAAHPGHVGQRGGAEGGHARNPAGYREGGRLLGEGGPGVAAQAEGQAACKQTVSVKI